MKPRPLVVLVLGLLALAGLTGLAIGRALRGPDRHAQIAVLAPLLPLFEPRHTTVFRNQDWCRALIDDTGAYASTPAPNCAMAPLGQVTKTFDDQAQREFERLATAVNATQVPTIIISLERDDAGVSSADFALEECMFCARSYHYDPRDAGPPIEDDLAPPRLLAPHWYFREQDWN